jgi:glycosyltransferase involved in cell wall biosynthesis
MPRFSSLTTFLPAWNEEEGLERAVRAVLEMSEALVAEGEIGTCAVLIVDDGSTDRTPEIADALAEHPSVSVVHHPVNRRLGGALRTGFEQASSELVLYMDADLPFDLAEVARAVRFLDTYDADLVSAYRFDRTGEGARRLVYSYTYNRLVRWLFGLRVRDVNFAFKLVHRRVLDEILPLESEGSFIDAEILVRAERLGFQIIQFGVDYFPRSRGVSTLSSSTVIRQLVREMLSMRRELLVISPRDRRRSDDS